MADRDTETRILGARYGNCKTKTEGKIDRDKYKIKDTDTEIQRHIYREKDTTTDLVLPRQNDKYTDIET